MGIRERTITQKSVDPEAPKFKEMDSQEAENKAKEMQEKMAKLAQEVKIKDKEEIKQEEKEHKQRTLRTADDLQKKLKKRTKTFVQEQQSKREEYKSEGEQDTVEVVDESLSSKQGKGK